MTSSHWLELTITQICTFVLPKEIAEERRERDVYVGLCLCKMLKWSNVKRMHRFARYDLDERVMVTPSDREILAKFISTAELRRNFQRKEPVAFIALFQVDDIIYFLKVLIWRNFAPPPPHTMHASYRRIEMSRRDISVNFPGEKEAKEGL